MAIRPYGKSKAFLLKRGGLFVIGSFLGFFKWSLNLS
jgi:hypothetical protein